MATGDSLRIGVYMIFLFCIPPQIPPKVSEREAYISFIPVSWVVRGICVGIILFCFNANDDCQKNVDSSESEESVKLCMY